MSFSQKESVYAAVKAYLNEKGISHEDGQRASLDKEGRRSVINMVTAAALAGEMSLKPEAQAKYASEKDMRKYCDGLVNNWLRKDTRLNGGEKHITQNPGSRAGQGDETVKNLRALKSQTNNPDHVAAIDTEIKTRLEAIKASKVKKVEVDFSKVPSSIRSLFNA